MTTESTVALAGQRANTYLFDKKDPSARLHYSVIVPVRNEAHHLSRTLEALRLQLDSEGLPLDPLTYEVLVLVNNCTDASLAIARSYQRRYPDFSLHIADIQLPPARANVGTVRRLLMDEAYRRLTSVGNSQGIIASTDGDTVVDSCWLWAIGQEIRRGADAVGGRILTHPDRNPVRMFHLRDVTFRSLLAQLEATLDPQEHDPWPRHFQHFGANLAVTCTMYQKAGRLPIVPYLEDEAFYRALLRIDARIRQSPQVKVVTSARMQGRVAIGFSEQLRCWATMQKKGQCQLVEPVGAWTIRFSCRRDLRRLWGNAEAESLGGLIAEMAEKLGISTNWLSAAVGQFRYFGELWEAVEQQMVAAGEWSQKWPLVPIRTAISELRAMRFMVPTAVGQDQMD